MITIIITLLLLLGTPVFFLCHFWPKCSKLNVVPQGSSVRFEIPPNSSRYLFSKFELKIEIIEIEVKLSNLKTREQAVVSLTKEFFFKDFPITPETPYSYKWRTKNNFRIWSQWSDLESFVSQPTPFPVIVSQAKSSEYLENIKKGKNFTALLLGKTGAGKSSFVNSLASAIAGRYRPIARTAPSGTTTTQGLVEHELIPGKIHIYDTPGIEENFNLDLFKQILEGKVANITVDRLKGDISASDPERTEEPMISRIDLVILVISASDLIEKKEFHDFNRIINLLKELCIPYLAVGTQWDKIASKNELKICRNKFYEDYRVLEQIRKIPVDATFPMVNYKPGDINRPEVNEILFQILQTAQDLAHSDLVKLGK